MYAIIKVSGDSMSPTLKDGDYILTKKPRSLRPGLIYVVQHGTLGRIVKRLTEIDSEAFWFEGDNAASTSTEDIGVVTQNSITARAVLAITPKGLKRL